MHPSTPPTRRRRDATPWFGRILTWTIPTQPRYLMPMRSTHYAGRTHELVKISGGVAQQLRLATHGWHFTNHPHRNPATHPAMGPALGRDLRTALTLAEAWLIAPPADVVASKGELTPDLLLSLAGRGPTFDVNGRVFMVWPRPEDGCLGLHEDSRHLTERGPELGALEPRFELSDCAAAEPHQLRWRPRLHPAFGGGYLEPSPYWREALITLAHNVKGRTRV